MNIKRALFPLLAALVLAACFLGADGLYRYAEAKGEADRVAELDAGVAPAGPTVAPPIVLPDPIAQPAEAGNAVWTLYKDGALAPAVVLAVFFLLVALRNKLPYFKTGRRAAVVAAVLGGVTMLAERAGAGVTPNLSMLVAAAMAGIVLYVNGSKASEAAKVPQP